MLNLLLLFADLAAASQPLPAVVIEVPATGGPPVFECKEAIAEAEAYRAERVNRSRGEAGRFSAILTEYKRAPEITRQRLYLEMIDNVLPKAGPVYIMEEGANSPLPLLNLGQPLGGSTGGK
ncbi:MAG TPA: hypothetical protein PLF88_03435 [Opitutaceae bacterium]|nr:hypothetical protein [Opitutaceae bacterium]